MAVPRTSELRIVVAASVAAAAFILLVGSVFVWREWQRGRRRLRERARPFVRAAQQTPARVRGAKHAELELQTSAPEERVEELEQEQASASNLREELGRMRAENERLLSLVEPPQYSDDIPQKV